MNEQSSCPDKEILLAALYEDAGEADRRLAEEHVAVCSSCAEEVESLRGVRETLARWTPPSRDLGFRLVRDPRVAGEPRRFWTRPIPLWAQAAAAVLILSAGAAIANLDIRYGSEGFAITTGWQKAGVSEGQAVGASATPAAASAAPWRDDLAMLEERLRHELASLPRSDEAARLQTNQAALGAAPAQAFNEAQFLKRVQALIAESEERQKRELALRTWQLSRELRLDLAQVEQSLVQLDGRSGAEAAKNREILDYLMRVSSQIVK